MIHDMCVQLPITGHHGTDEENEMWHRVYEEFEEALDGSGEMIGSDIGNGTLNFFIGGIADLAPTVERVKSVLDRNGLLADAVINVTRFQNPDGRPLEERVIWPENHADDFRTY
jgi:hypothetical protein